MFEGKELEGKIGSVGQYTVDIKEDAKVEADLGIDHKFAEWLGVTVSLKLDLDPIAGLKLAFANSSNALVKGAVEGLAKIFGR